MVVYTLLDTVLERIAPDASNRVRDSNARQAATARERRTTDAGNRIGNGDVR